MMREIRRHVWFLRVAVLAIGGMVLASTGASACETSGEGARRACCSTASAPKHGGCCDANRTPPAKAAPRSAAVDSSTSILIPLADSASCECRADEPAAPADHQGRTSTDRWEVEGFGLSAIAAPVTGRPPQIDRSSLPSERPPKVPLYLRASRLRN